MLNIDTNEPLAVAVVEAIRSGDLDGLNRLLHDMPLVEKHFAGPVRPTPDDVNAAFWQACHGGQLAAAQYLFTHGADLNKVPGWTKETPLDIAKCSGVNALVEWLRDQGAKSAKELS